MFANGPVKFRMFLKTGVSYDFDLRTLPLKQNQRVTDLSESDICCMRDDALLHSDKDSFRKVSENPGSGSSDLYRTRWITFPV